MKKLNLNIPDTASEIQNGSVSVTARSCVAPKNKYFASSITFRSPRSAHAYNAPTADPVRNMQINL